MVHVFALLANVIFSSASVLIRTMMMAFSTAVVVVDVATTSTPQNS